MSSIAADSPRDSKEKPEAQPGAVNFEGTALVELSIDEHDYRIDAGKQGTALSISMRPSGTWDWSFCGEARWDGSDLRGRAFERRVLQVLSSAFAEALANLE
ncbi:MAG TPA: hypothetical protein VGI10_02525 [Polyangiaceae bacterium]|jgi:hypothetical protein